MSRRQTLTSETVEAIASEVAGHPLGRKRAEAHTKAAESILQSMETLRAAPLKDIEPAVIYRPVDRRD